MAKKSKAGPKKKHPDLVREHRLEVQLNGRERKEIETAASQLGVGLAVFMRDAAIERAARTIISKKK